MELQTKLGKDGEEESSLLQIQELDKRATLKVADKKGSEKISTVIRVSEKISLGLHQPNYISWMTVPAMENKSSLL